MKLFSARDQQLQRRSGFALFYAVMVIAVVSSLGIVLTNMLRQQSTITATTRESVQAFYAADSGVECARYWDSQGRFPPNPGPPPSGTVSDIECAGETGIRVSYTDSPSSTEYNFTINANNGAAVCAQVQVAKRKTNGATITEIESTGFQRFNTCPPSGGNPIIRRLDTTY